MKHKNKIENFIGVYDNYLLKDQCENAIKLFEGQHKFNQTVNRQNFEGADLHQKKMTCIFVALGM